MASNSENIFDIFREPLFTRTPVPPPIIHQRGYRDLSFINNFPTVYNPNITIWSYLNDEFDSDDSDEEEML